MAEQHFNPENIIDLAEELRLAGFDLGTQQYVAAQDLLIALAGHNRLPADPREWRTLLSPIFCSTPGEQEDFYLRFDLWLKRHPELMPTIAGSAKTGRFGKTGSLVISARNRFPWLRQPRWMAAISLLTLLFGFAGYLAMASSHTLTGQVFSSEGDKSNPLPEAQVEFFNQQVKTDGNGNFIANYRARNWHRIFNRQLAELKIAHGEHDPHSPITLDVHQPSHQTIKLQKRQPQISGNSTETLQQISGNSTETLPPTTEAAPPAISLLPEFNALKPDVGGAPKTIRWYHWLMAALPLLLFAVWRLLRWQSRRALLQKLQAAGNPNLRRLTVRGANEQLFQSQAFRRATQELRRHRRVRIKDLDVPGTVHATINRGGMFQPLYGSRKALPEYLLLIDRASPGDEQARFAEELSHRLESGGVFVDRYYFQNDPRTCRQREPNSPTFTLHELAARYPEHQLLIFSDGAGLISPITGEPEHWLTSFSHWPRRVLLTPELSGQKDYREFALTENDFLLLPANDDGLAMLTEAINAGALPNLKTKQDRNGNSNPFPRLIQERPKRWLERHEPRPAVLNELCDQLRAYLGDKSWHWLAACAVYPALSWDVTLYLGYTLTRHRVGSPTVKEGLDPEAEALADARATDTAFEERLLRLIRLPWFRYGSMPDWLRLRLIESFTPEQESEVRQTVEAMLLSALENPRGGIPLEIAEAQPAEPGNWLQKLKAKLTRWRQKRRLAGIVKNEPEESLLRDHVFLGFLSGSATKRLTVILPDLLRRALFPQGQTVLGLRPSTGLISALLSASFIGAVLFYSTTPPSLTTPDPNQIRFYQQMSDQARMDFIEGKVEAVLEKLGGDSVGVDAHHVPQFLGGYLLEVTIKSPEGSKVARISGTEIRDYLDSYERRVGNGSTTNIFSGGDLRPTFNEDLKYVFGRGVNLAPVITKAFTGSQAPPVAGLYAAMVESEFTPCLKNSIGGLGIFQLTEDNALRFGLDPNARCDVAGSAQAAASFLAGKIREYGSDPFAVTLALASLRDETEVNRIIAKYPNEPKSFWTLQNHSDEIPVLTQKGFLSLVPQLIAAAIVGENPQSFGLDMKPLSTYTEIPPDETQTGTGSATTQPGTTGTPQTNATSRPQPVCRKDLSEKDGYGIHAVKLQKADRTTVDFSNLYPIQTAFMGQIYKSGDSDRIKSEAEGLLKSEGVEPSSVKVCVTVANESQCRKTGLGARCVNVFLYSRQTVRNDYPVSISEGTVNGIREITRTFTDPNCPIERVVRKEDRGSLRSIEVFFRNGRRPVSLTGAQAETNFLGNCAAIVRAVNSISLAQSLPPEPGPQSPGVVDKELIGLLGSLKDGSSLNRKQSAYAFWFRSTKDQASVRTAIAELIPFLKDNDPGVRAWVALALAESGVRSNEVKRVLEEAQKSVDEEIRKNAIKALSKMAQQER